MSRVASEQSAALDAMGLLWRGTTRLTYPGHGYVLACMARPALAALGGDPSVEAIVAQLAEAGDLDHAHRRLGALTRVLRRSGALAPGDAFGAWFTALKTALGRTRDVEAFCNAFVMPRVPGMRRDGRVVLDHRRTLEVCHELALRCLDPQVKTEWATGTTLSRLEILCDVERAPVIAFLDGVVQTSFDSMNASGGDVFRMGDLQAVRGRIMRLSNLTLDAGPILWGVITGMARAFETEPSYVQQMLRELMFDDGTLQRPSYAEAIGAIGEVRR